jgi:hypothetical protein
MWAMHRRAPERLPTPTADAIDAGVVVGALRGDSIVTSDRRDIERLANAAGRRVNVIAV